MDELVVAGWKGEGQRPRRRANREVVGTAAVEPQPASTDAPLVRVAAAAAAESATARSDAPSDALSTALSNSEYSYESYTPKGMYTPASSLAATDRAAAPAAGAGLGVGIGASREPVLSTAAAAEGGAARLLLVARAFTDGPCEADAAVQLLRTDAVTALPSHALLCFEAPWQAGAYYTCM